MINDNQINAGWDALKRKCCATRPDTPAFERVTTVIQVRFDDFRAAVEAALAEPALVMTVPESQPEPWRPTVGRDARTRDGRRATVDGRDDGDGLFPLYGSIEGGFATWTGNGLYLFDGESIDDLIADWSDDAIETAEQSEGEVV